MDDNQVSVFFSEKRLEIEKRLKKVEKVNILQISKFIQKYIFYLRHITLVAMTRILFLKTLIFIDFNPGKNY